MAEATQTTFTERLDRAGIWWGFLGPNGIVSVGLAFIYSFFEPVAKYGWAAVALAALATAMLFTLVASAGLLAWRKFKPLTSDLSTPAQHLLATMTGEEGSGPGVGELEASISTLESDLSSLSAKFDGMREAFSSRLDEISEKLELVRVDGVINEKSLKTIEEKLEKECKQRALSFYALRTIDALESLEADMRRDAEDLSAKLLSGGKYDDQSWQSWESVNHHWESNLKNWEQHAKWYAFETEKRIFAVEENEFGGSWTITDDQFPTADAQRRFKRFRILERHWEGVRDEVMNGINSVAFHGLTDEEVRNVSRRAYE